jgi:hypothetical protein
VLAAVVIIKHHANIKRLIKGEEPIMSIFDKSKKKKEEESTSEEQ